MYLEIYPDIVFVLNFVIDFVLLIILKKVNRKNSSLGKLLLAAAIGALITAFISMFPWINANIGYYYITSLLEVSTLILKLGSSVLMLLLAFGRMKRMDFLKQVISFYFITYFVGGMMNSIYYNTNIKLVLMNLGDTLVFSNISWKFVILILLCLLPVLYVFLWLQRLYKSNERETYEVELVLEDRSIKTNGLFDTGNCLYDPIYKRPVMVIERSLLEELLSEEYLREFDHARNYLKNVGDKSGELKTNEQPKADTQSENEGLQEAEEQSRIKQNVLLRLRFIPYQCVGSAQGMMFGLLLDKVFVHKGKETICCEKVTAAICDNRLSLREEYHVILHKDLL